MLCRTACEGCLPRSCIFGGYVNARYIDGSGHDRTAWCQEKQLTTNNQSWSFKGGAFGSCCSSLILIFSTSSKNLLYIRSATCEWNTLRRNGATVQHTKNPVHHSRSLAWHVDCKTLKWSSYLSWKLVLCLVAWQVPLTLTLQPRQLQSQPAVDLSTISQKVDSTCHEQFSHWHELALTPL